MVLFIAHKVTNFPRIYRIPGPIFFFLPPNFLFTHHFVTAIKKNVAGLPASHIIVKHYYGLFTLFLNA